nr:FlgD immunoglobulin-like domain containing protein [bacterium]HPN32797.1 FlgD immunoglobulin-like domain containing protein [bacterium]
TLNGGDVILYGDSAPEIQFTNVKAVVSDQVILKNALGLVVDELDYSPSLGAENIGGPNETSLERLSPFVRTNDSSNWAYSMEQGGSPGRRNSAHYVWNLSIEPTLFNPTLLDTEGINSCTIAYYQSVSGTATINIYDENYNLIRTLINNVHRQPGIYYAVWNGRDSADTFAFSVNTVEIEVVDDTEQRTCVHKINDASFLGFNDVFDLSMLMNYYYDFGTGYFFLAKPARTSVLVKTEPAMDTIAVICKNAPMGAGSNSIQWDGRNDSGLFLKGFNQEIGMLIKTQDILGNAVITAYPLEIDPLIAFPPDYFNPVNSETQGIFCYVNKMCDLTVKIYDENNILIKTILESSPVNKGYIILEWDGKDSNEEIVKNGFYTVTVTATEGYYYKKRAVEINVNKL